MPALSLLLGALLCAPPAAAMQAKVRTAPAPVTVVPPVVRLNTLVLQARQPVGLGSLGRAPLAAPSAQAPLDPTAFADLAEAQQAMRMSKFTQRIAAAAAAELAPAQGVKPVSLGAQGLGAASLGGKGAESSGRDAAPGERAPVDAAALAAADKLTGVDLKNLSDAVESVMGGMAPGRIGEMSDEEFAQGAQRILALLEGRADSARARFGDSEAGIPSPEKAAAFLRDIAPGLQNIANDVLRMRPGSDDASCAACGTASMGLRDAVKIALRRRFPEGNMDILLEVGRLDGPGDPVQHVFLKVVSRKSAIRVEPLAIIDFTAAQKPGNLAALGFQVTDTLVLPWSSDIYERYPFARVTGDGAMQMMRKVEAAAGVQAKELDERASRYVGGAEN